MTTRSGIDYLKRYAADIDIEDPWVPELPARNGKKVAIVGGGPAGLTCAYFLTLKGYSPTIFENLPKLGGMLRYGIPEYRLPKAMLDREIKWITDLGVEVKTGAKLGKDFTLESLKKGYAAVFLALGAQKAKTMGVADEEKTKGVLGGVDFLGRMQSAKPPAISGTVVVVGGGNTAVDAARTSLRIGAKKVIIVYRRTVSEMPAHPMEVEAAAEEGVEMTFLSAPVSIVAKNGKLKALRCNRMELGEMDASGRRSPKPVPGSEYDIPCDFIISAIGQDIDLGTLDTESGVKATRQKAIVVDKESFVTSIPGVFAGGDVATGPAVAIDAIAHGKRAALAIDQYIQTGKMGEGTKAFISKKDAFGEIPQSEFAQIKHIDKERMPEMAVAERVKGQAEVELGLHGSAGGERGVALPGVRLLRVFRLRPEEVRERVRRRYRQVQGRHAEVQGRYGPSVYHPRPQQMHQLRPLRQDVLGDTADIGARLRQQGLQVGSQAVHGENPPGDDLRLLRQLHSRLPDRGHYGEDAFLQAGAVDVRGQGVGLHVLLGRVRPQLPGLRGRPFHRLERERDFPQQGLSLPEGTLRLQVHDGEGPAHQAAHQEARPVAGSDMG